MGTTATKICFLVKHIFILLLSENEYERSRSENVN